MGTRDDFPWRRFLAPRYWPVWLSLGVMRVVVYLPYRLQRMLATAMSVPAGLLMRKRLRIARINLDICFPALDARERGRLLRAHVRSLAMGLFEAAECWWGDPDALRRRTRIDGLEHLEAARAAGRPVILLSGHFTTLEIGGRLLGLFSPFHLMYRPNDNALLEEVIRRNREHHFEKAIPRDEAKDMLASLKAGFAVWYAPDQSYRRKNSEMVPFFGRPAPTNTATARIARITGAAVLPFFIQRLPGLQGYRLELQPPLEDFPSGDPEADALRVNRVIEDQVRRAPEQYIWIHRRFKPPPGGGEDIYPS